jgi:hypothetical protein
LKCIRCNFGKQAYRKSKYSHVDVFLTFQNVGGVTSEFYFKFQDDINIKREIWMEHDETQIGGDYRISKEKIFEIEPRKNKLKPGECCNIRFRYNVKEIGDHRLKIMFQIVNGKPIIFELYGETINEKNALLDIPNPSINFHFIPMGYVNYFNIDYSYCMSY